MQQSEINSCESEHELAQPIELYAICCHPECQVKFICNTCLTSDKHDTHQDQIIIIDDLKKNLVCQTQELKNAQDLFIEYISKLHSAKTQLLLNLNSLEKEFMIEIQTQQFKAKQIEDIISYLKQDLLSSIKSPYQQILLQLLQEQYNLKNITNENQTNLQFYIDTINQQSSNVEASLEKSKLKLFTKEFMTNEETLQYYHQNFLDYSKVPNNMEHIRGKFTKHVYEKGAYLGEMISGKRNGKGLLIFTESGKICEGIWNKDQLLWGNQTFQDTYGLVCIRQGYFKNHKIQGEGKILISCGETYIGQFKDGVREGFGIFKYNTGAKYIGEWKGDTIQGKGVLYYSNGDKYEGEFADSKREGNGIFTVYSGIRYEGMFVNNKLQGNFKITYPSGEYSYGNYYEGKASGDFFVFKKGSDKPFLKVVHDQNGKIIEEIEMSDENN